MTTAPELPPIMPPDEALALAERILATEYHLTAPVPSDDECDAAIMGIETRDIHHEYGWQRAIYRAGYAAGQAAPVPREPTQAMIDAGAARVTLWSEWPQTDAMHCWKAMYDAASAQEPCADHGFHEHISSEIGGSVRCGTCDRIVTAPRLAPTPSPAPTDDLVARLRKLAELGYQFRRLHVRTALIEAADAIEARDAELEAARRDAMRYRWLRNMPEDAVCWTPS